MPHGRLVGEELRRHVDRHPRTVAMFLARWRISRVFAP